MLTLRSPLVRFGPWLVIATIALAAVTTWLASPDAQAESGRYGGDFPSFYGAGGIVLDGDGSDLYDVETQKSAQAESFSDGDILFFAYPPYTAAVYAGVAWLPYGAAYAVHSLLAIAALVGALAMLRPFVRGVFDGWARLGLASVAAIASYPVLRSVLGGQNATFTLLGLAAVARFDDDERPIATGIAAATLLYKPQFGLVVIGVLVLSRRWTAVGSAIAVSAALYGVGAIVMGFDWISTWISAISDFGDLNIAVNGHLMISAWGWVQNLLGVDTVSYILAGAIALAVGVPMAYGLIAKRWTAIPWYALAPLIVVVAPSALYYDATLLLLPIAIVIGWAADRVALVLVGLIALSWTQVFAGNLGWSPLFPPILAMAALFSLSALKSDRLPVAPNRYTR
jgi:hypothetical protein